MRDRLKELAASLRQRREEAWLEVPRPLYLVDGKPGPLVRPLTPFHTLLLQGLNNPLLRSGQWSMAGALQLLWIINPEWTSDAKAALRFARAWRKRLRVDLARPAIAELIDTAFADLPKAQPAPVADPALEDVADLGHEFFLTSLVDLFGHEYGWTPEQTMHMPWAQIGQLYGAITNRYASKKEPRFTALDKLSALILKDE